ncbi:MAG: IS1 family transposase [Candidatus Dormibacteria bacterium]
MNRLSQVKRAQVVKALVEGNSILATVRITGVAKNTVAKLLVELGEACSEYQDEILGDLTCRRIECVEIWSFRYATEANVPAEHKNEFGYVDMWTWVAIDADTRLVPGWLVGERDSPTAIEFMTDLGDRLANRVQLTTDGLTCYLVAAEGAFGVDMDYAQLVKVYGTDRVSERLIHGAPAVALASISDPEPQTLKMRMGMQRFTRLTNGFSKKAENLAAAVSLHFMHYNFARPHETLANPYPRTPAMAVGVTDHVWPVEEIVGLLSS